MQTEPIPFKRIDESLKDNLRKIQIPNVARWLVGGQQAGVLALASNSYWEASLSIEFLVWAQQLFQQAGEHPELCKEITGRISETANRLIKAARFQNHEQFGQMCNWEGVTWDTAVIIRGLLTALKASPQDFTHSKRDAIHDAIIASLQWLAFRFDSWEKDVKFPFGVSDVAQILITLIFLRLEHPQLVDRANRIGYLSLRHKTTQEPLEVLILRYLLKEANTIPYDITTGSSLSDSPNSEELFCWENFFHTAEVTEALAYAFSAASKPSQCPVPKKAGKLIHVFSDSDLHKTRVALTGALRYLETHQVNGEWGSHVDTIRCLYAYIKATYLTNEQPEPHILFRALRWGCDEKQVFSDGSFLHTMFLTVFYCLALQEAHDHWLLSAKPVIELYDDVVWASPTSTTAERGKRMQAEMKLDDTELVNQTLKYDLSTWKRMAFTLVVIVICFILGTQLCTTLQICTMSMSTRIDEQTRLLTFNINAEIFDRAQFNSIVAIIVAVLIGVMTLVWTRSDKKR